MFSRVNNKLFPEYYIKHKHEGMRHMKRDLFKRDYERYDPNSQYLKDKFAFKDWKKPPLTTAEAEANEKKNKKE